MKNLNGIEEVVGSIPSGSTIYSLRTAEFAGRTEACVISEA
jgi:hypothetical protein